MARMRYKKRADGRYEAKIYIGVVDGKRKYKTVYGVTQKETQAKADAVRLQLGKGLDVSPTNETFQFWVERWLETKKRVCTPAQAKAYEHRIEYFAQPLGHLPIGRIKLHQLQEVLDGLANKNPYTGKPSAKKTLRDYAQTAFQAFEYAIDNRIIEYNPAKGLSIPRSAPKSNRRALTLVERQMVLTTPHRAQTAAMLMMLAGLRRGEVTALLWEDIDIERKTISITKGYDFKNKQVKSPKTSAGRRVISIPDELATYLKGLPDKEGLVFPSKAGTMMLEPAWQRLWKYYMNELNRQHGNFDGLEFEKNRKWPVVIDTFTPHCLRHTYCTLLHEAGIDVVTAKELMGHSDIKTTLGVYTHLSKEKAERDMQKLNDLLCSSNARQKSKETIDT